ncbi:hypothetical protein K504DRAFT_462131 [Pleomassaria siparia CBS 279.74]|uniref:Uncharacterized protein n=1 Tax=Pleomassaria siparia CBS 279.74 TaxID=1314801 RepID=A0A6G1KMA0_9PLEO|nr:hypothetical protein K504DRAFT_462131 [Pleomassaria siparia CBS 279.74]
MTSTPVRKPIPWSTASSSSPLMDSDALSSTPSNPLADSVMSSNRDFPPNTPDRPAPLKLRSCRSSSATPNTSTNTASRRSVSAPVCNTKLVRPAPPPLPKKNNATYCFRSISGETMVEGNEDDTNSLFSTRTTDHHKKLSPELVDREIRDMFRKMETNGGDTSESERSSPSSQDLCAQGENDGAYQDYERNPDHYEFDKLECNTHLKNVDVFGAIHVPQTESAVRSGGAAPGNHYSLPSPRKRPLAIVGNPVSTPSQRRVSTQGLRSARLSNPLETSFHRSLPLRRYESEAFMYPTFHSQSESSTRSPSSASTGPLRGEHAVQIGDSDETTHRNGFGNPQPCNPSARRASSVSQVSLVLSSDSTEIEASPLSPFSDLYKSVTSMYFLDLLRKTRARGAQLPVVSKKSVSMYELAWREENEVLITSIYGSHDVEISSTEMDLIDRIAKSVREGGSIEGNEWVGGLFLQE